jgi:hypothetical protein
MNKSIFSTYSQGENRVTSTIISVFERINLSTLLLLFQNLMNDISIELVKYDNQIKSSKFESVPDARIKGSFNYFIETKIKKKAVNRKQIEGHLTFLDSDITNDNRLLILTPDSDQPKIISNYEGKNVYWFNFDMLIDGIENILENYSFITEREKYLFVELIQFIEDSNLKSENITNKVLLIPSSVYARTHYQNHKVYICQPNRSFQKTNYMAFYGNNKIYREVPKIMAKIEQFDLKNQDIRDAKIDLINSSDQKEILDRLDQLKSIILSENWELNGNNKIIFLSRSAEEGTEYLDNEVVNDKRSKDNTRRTAYTQKQTYEDLNVLKSVKYTSEIK